MLLGSAAPISATKLLSSPGWYLQLESLWLQVLGVVVGRKGRLLLQHMGSPLRGTEQKGKHTTITRFWDSPKISSLSSKSVIVQNSNSN